MEQERYTVGAGEQLVLRYIVLPGESRQIDVAVDLAGGKTVHREIMIGGAASGGGRFATVGGADAVFVLPRTTVSALTASLTQ